MSAGVVLIVNDSRNVALLLLAFMTGIVGGSSIVLDQVPVGKEFWISFFVLSVFLFLVLNLGIGFCLMAAVALIFLFLRVCGCIKADEAGERNVSSQRPNLDLPADGVIKAQYLNEEERLRDQQYLATHNPSTNEAADAVDDTPTFEITAEEVQESA